MELDGRPRAGDERRPPHDARLRAASRRAPSRAARRRRSPCSRARCRSTSASCTLDGDTVASFEEKPVLSYDVSMGVYAFEQRVVELIPQRGSATTSRIFSARCSSAAGRCTRIARATSGSTSAARRTTSSRIERFAELRDELLPPEMTRHALADHARRRRARRARAGSAVDDVLRGGWLSMGPITEQFEAEFSRYRACPATRSPSRTAPPRSISRRPRSGSARATR